MHYKIRYPGSRPRTSTARPKNPQSWMHGGTMVIGLHVAGQCIVCLLIFGFGLSGIGALSLLMSVSTNVSEGQYQTPPAIVGFAFLACGLSVLLVGLVFFCCAARRAKRMYIRERTAVPSSKEKYKTLESAGAPITEEEWENAQNDQTVYSITTKPDATNPDQLDVQNEVNNEKMVEPDSGFTGFTYSNVEQEPAVPAGESTKKKLSGLLSRGLPSRLPPIVKNESKTVYSTPATFGRKE